ncbi:MAG: hypothetical protein R3E97_01875 [Candidatus Eisenbacteria bacterium]
MELAVVLLVIVFGPLTAKIASRRGHPWLGWALLPATLGAQALFLLRASGASWATNSTWGGAFVLVSGLLGTVIALLIPMTKDARHRRGLEAGTLRLCPHCAEPIQSVATTCCRCGKSLSGIGGESTNEFMKRVKEQYGIEDESPS